MSKLNWDRVRSRDKEHRHGVQGIKDRTGLERAANRFLFGKPALLRKLAAKAARKIRSEARMKEQFACAIERDRDDFAQRIKKTASPWKSGAQSRPKRVVRKTGAGGMNNFFTKAEWNDPATRERLIAEFKSRPKPKPEPAKDSTSRRRKLR